MVGMDGWALEDWSVCVCVCDGERERREKGVSDIDEKIHPYVGSYIYNVHM